MEINRRHFGAGALSALAQCALPGVLHATGARQRIAATTRQADGSHAALIYDLEQGVLQAVSLPQRGHDIAVNPVNGECVAFARRPGNFAIAWRNLS